MQKTKNKAILWSLVLILVIFSPLVLAACGGKDENPQAPALIGYEVNLYFVNSQYAVTGDESLPHYLVETREIQVSADENPWIYVLNSLREPSGMGTETAIRDDVIFNQVYVSKENNEVMIVDLESVGTGGGSLQEGFFIGQIVESIINTGPLLEEDININKVQFLIKGQKIDSLMGHFDASMPFGSEQE